MGLRAWFERDVGKLASEAARWQALAAQALEPNPFYEPWFVLPALRLLPELARDCGVLFVEEDRKIVGALPLVLGPWRRGVPWKRARFLTHKYSFCHTPLLSRSCAAGAWQAMLEWCRDAHAPVLELEHIYGDGPFHRLAARGSTSFLRAQHDRAFFVPNVDAEAYQAAAMSAKHRREIARRERNLFAAGKLELPELGLGHDGPIAPFIEGFLALEAAGWKGTGHTAFANRDRDRKFFIEVVQGGHEQGRIWFENATLDGKLIASLLNFVAGPGSYSWKICYDEKLSKLSPGVFIEIVNLRRLHERRQIEWMDSGATPDHPMLNRLWLDRKPIETRWLSTGGRASGWFLTALPWVQRARALLRRPAGAAQTVPESIP